MTKRQHSQVCAQAAGCTDMLLVFPLYADGLPVTLMHFLKQLAQQEFQAPPTVHMLINCGFLEPRQNDVACDMVRLFCAQHGFPFGSVLRVGSGEAILTTPLCRPCEAEAEKAGAGSRRRAPLQRQRHHAAARPGCMCGLLRGIGCNTAAKNGLGKEQMAAMQIEGGAE